jgi:hypothetical protein
MSLLRKRQKDVGTQTIVGDNFVAWYTHVDGEHVAIALSRPAMGTSFGLPKDLEAEFEPGSLAELLIALAAASEQPDPVAIQAFVLKDPPDYIVMTVTVTVGPAAAPPELSEVTDGEAQVIELPAGVNAGNTLSPRAVRIRRVVDWPIRTTRPPEPLRVVQYLLTTDFGPVGFTFAAPHAEGFTEMEDLFGRMFGNARVEVASK